mgnify:FL=1
MTEIKEKALAKMLEELNKPHDISMDRIHNWICDQEDEDLFQGILKDGYSIKCSLDYAKNKARKFAENGVACIDDETVYSWVKEYFLSNSSVNTLRQVPVEAKKKQANANPKPQQTAAKTQELEQVKKKIKKEKGVVEGQLDLFAELA